MRLVCDFCFDRGWTDDERELKKKNQRERIRCELRLDDPMESKRWYKVVGVSGGDDVELKVREEEREK